MQQCPNCGHPNRAGVVFCENCGASLIGKMPLDTKSLGTATDEEKADIGVDSSVLTDVKVQGISSFTEGDMLRLEIEGSPEPVILEPKAEAIFGRRDPATGALPDIDLTPYAGYRMGVSRRHAAIRQSSEQSLELWDLGSSNGTYLNGQRLNAHRPYRLHNGDEIRLGQMMIRVSFESGGGKKPAETAKREAPAETAAAAPTGEKAEVSAPAPAKPETAVADKDKAEGDKPSTDTISAETVAKALEPAPAESVPEEAAAKSDEKPVEKPDEKPSKPEAKTEPEAEAKPSAEKADAEQKKEPETDEPEKPAAEAKPDTATDDKQPEEPEAKASSDKPSEPEKPAADKKADDDDKPDSTDKKRD